MSHGPLIDTHQHPIPDYYKRALERVGIHGSGENPWADWSLEAQLELMDETGIAAAINSIASPGVYFGDNEFARNLRENATKAPRVWLRIIRTVLVHSRSYLCRMSRAPFMQPNMRLIHSSWTESACIPCRGRPSWPAGGR